MDLDDVPGTVRALADRFHERWLATHPFEASYYGIPGYDERVPDDSEAGGAAWRGELESIQAVARRLDQPRLAEADAITVRCLIESIGQELRELDTGLIEHTVTAMPFSGPAVFISVAGRTVLADTHAAADYLERLRRSGEWIDQQTERLRIGAGKGRLATCASHVAAACLTRRRAASKSVAISASLNAIAWRSAIFLPNVSRSWA